MDIKLQIFCSFLLFVPLLLSEFIITGAIVFKKFVSERVDSNPFRDVDQGIEEIEDNECNGERIGEWRVQVGWRR